MPYMLTSKVESKSKNHLVLLPNLLILILLCGAWALGQSLGATVHPLVFIVASIFFVGSIVLIWTDFREFPAPYDKALIGNAVEIWPEPAHGQKPHERNY